MAQVLADTSGVYAVMERLGIKAAFGFDPHFQQYGFALVS